VEIDQLEVFQDLLLQIDNKVQEIQALQLVEKYQLSLKLATYQDYKSEKTLRLVFLLKDLHRCMLNLKISFYSLSNKE